MIKKNNKSPIKKARVKIALPLFYFRDGDLMGFYSPAFRLKVFGKDEQEATNSLDALKKLYLNKWFRKKGNLKELKDIGWTIKPSKMRSFNPPSIMTMLSKDECLRVIFEKESYHKLNYTLSMPGYLKATD